MSHKYAKQWRDNSKFDVKWELFSVAQMMSMASPYTRVELIHDVHLHVI